MESCVIVVAIACSDNLESGKQRMVRAAILKELFDDGYEDLEERLMSSSLVAREMGFNPEPPERHDPLARSSS